MTNHNFIPLDDWCIDNIDKDFLFKYWDYSKNILNPHNIGKGSRNKIWIKCQETDYHGSYEVRAYSFTKGIRCPCCSGKVVHKYDSFGYKYPNVIKLWSDKNILSPYHFTYGSGRDIYLKCKLNKHDDYKTKPYRASEHDFRCPSCSDENTKSYIQSKVERYLIDQFSFNILNEENCSIIAINPKRIKNSNMPYDIEIPCLNLLIEVQGEQHYHITGWTRSHAKRNGTSPEYELKQQKLRDRYKKYVAYVNGYNYLAIPYWFEFQDTYESLLLNTIYKIILKSPNSIGDFLL